MGGRCENIKGKVELNWKFIQVKYRNTRYYSNSANNSKIEGEVKVGVRNIFTGIKTNKWYFKVIQVSMMLKHWYLIKGRFLDIHVHTQRNNE